MRYLIERNLKGKIIVPFFLLAGIFYAIMMTVTIPKMMVFSGGMKILDMMPTGYDAAYVNALLNTLGEKGRHAYLFNQIPFDMVFPLLFGISLCLILAYILKKLGKSESNFFYICFLPLFSALFDYCENIGVIIILNNYPDYSNILVLTTNVFSVLKSIFTIINVIILITFLIVLGMRKFFLKDKLH